MSSKNWLAALACIATAVVLSAGAAASAAEPAVGVVCNVKVLSDKVPDVSSLAAWKKSFIRDGMTDKEKAMAVWQSAVTFQHQDGPPLEFLQAENTVLDTIKIFNVYGYSLLLRGVLERRGPGPLRRAGGPRLDDQRPQSCRRSFATASLAPSATPR